MGSAVGGITGGLFGASNSPSAPNLSTYQPTGTAAFDQSFQNLLNSNINNNPYASYTPQATATFNQQYNNPYASGYQSAANTAGAAYGATGAADMGAANALTGAGNTGLTAANQTLQQSLDPQNALYQRTLQQLNDQVGVNSAQRGITNSPYGASVANSADSNFNIDWQNNQLQRALQGLSGYTSGVAGANSDFTGANTLGTAGAGNINNAGALPFATSNAITSNQNDALNQLLSVIGNSGEGAYNTNNLNELMSYLGLGTGQANVQAGLNQQSYQDALNASNSAASGVGGIASGLTNALNSLGGGQNTSNLTSSANSSGLSSLFNAIFAAAPDAAAAA